jgi:poly(A) polymerase
MSAPTERAMQALRQTAPNAYYVGGCVRDWLLKRPLKDLDIAVTDDVEAVGRQTADRLSGVFFWLRQEMNVARILVRGSDPLQIDVVPLAGSLENDLRRRDFTINAMAVSAETGLVEGAATIDPTGGLQDLAERRLRLAGPDALERDPLRCLRAFRLRAALDLTFDPSLELKLRAAGPHLREVSGERVRDELFVLLEGTQSASVMSELLAHDLVAPWSPVLAACAAGCPGGAGTGPDVSDAQPSGVTVLLELNRWLCDEASKISAAAKLKTSLDSEVTPPRSRKALTRLAALSVAAGSRVDEIPRSLCLSVDESRVVKRAVEGCRFLSREWPAAGSERLRFFQRCEPGAVEAVLLEIATERATIASAVSDKAGSARASGASLPHVQASIQLLADLLERRLHPPAPLLTGDEVMAILQLTPGPLVGQLLQEVEERRADGRLATAAEAREWLYERRPQ